VGVESAALLCRSGAPSAKRRSPEGLAYAPTRDTPLYRSCSMKVAVVLVMQVWYVRRKASKPRRVSLCAYPSHGGHAMLKASRGGRVYVVRSFFVCRSDARVSVQTGVGPHGVSRPGGSLEARTAGRRRAAVSWRSPVSGDKAAYAVLVRIAVGSAAC